MISAVFLALAIIAKNSSSEDTLVMFRKYKCYLFSFCYLITDSSYHFPRWAIVSSFVLMYCHHRTIRAVGYFLLSDFVLLSEFLEIVFDCCVVGCYNLHSVIWLIFELFASYSQYEFFQYVFPVLLLHLIRRYL